MLNKIKWLCVALATTAIILWTYDNVYWNEQHVTRVDRQGYIDFCIDYNKGMSLSSVCKLDPRCDSIDIYRATRVLSGESRGYFMHPAKCYKHKYKAAMLYPQ